MSEDKLYNVYFDPKEIFGIEVKARNQKEAKEIAFGKIAKQLCTKSKYNIEVEETTDYY